MENLIIALVCVVVLSKVYSSNRGADYAKASDAAGDVLSPVVTRIFFNLGLTATLVLDPLIYWIYHNWVGNFFNPVVIPMLLAHLANNLYPKKSVYLSRTLGVLWIGWFVTGLFY